MGCSSKQSPSHAALQVLKSALLILMIQFNKISLFPFKFPKFREQNCIVEEGEYFYFKKAPDYNEKKSTKTRKQLGQNIYWTKF